MTKKQKILIVDDRKENLVALRQVLSGLDAEIVEATTGNQALAATLDHEFAVAILDVQMPEMDGYELAELLRSDPKSKRIPIVFLTAEMREEHDVFKGYETGAVDYIVKPFNPLILLSKVNVFLELDRQSRELRSHKALLENANKELEAFSYSVSHDLQAPLRAIVGFSRIMLEEYSPKLDDEGRRLLDVIAANSQKMGQLIDDLLAFSRLSHQQIAFAPVDLAALADDVFSELKSTEKGQRIEFKIGALPAAFGDRSMLRQVLQNLLANAIKFTRPRTKARIEFGGQAAIGETIYYVKDNGVGFNMEYAHKLFGVFQRLHGSEEFEGTGVGLAIVKRIVSRHGGRVWAKSAAKGGATFYFSLPSATENETATGGKKPAVAEEEK
ncbi:MAG: hybrid sensor histidine kinase/response regulator [Betaproteobacteria bacterium]|nr:MAG: hybrid sensor histidine kinase/response regulator [Betaproteobacteria bacterium]